MCAMCVMCVVCVREEAGQSRCWAGLGGAGAMLDGAFGGFGHSSRARYVPRRNPSRCDHLPRWRNQVGDMFITVNDYPCIDLRSGLASLLLSPRLPLLRWPWRGGMDTELYHALPRAPTIGLLPSAGLGVPDPPRAFAARADLLC